MNTSVKSFKSLAVSVAAVITASFWAGLFGNAIGDAMNPPQEIPTTTAHTAQPLWESSDPTDPYFENDSPMWYGPRPTQYNPGTAIDDPDATFEQETFPTPDALDIPALQSDGGEVHCRPQGNIVAKSASANDNVALNNNLIELWSTGEYLMVSPHDTAIGKHQVAVVVNGTRANWLPATPVGGTLALSAYNWMSDETMSWHIQFCSVTE